MTEETKLILIHETIGESIARDIGTYATVVAFWTLGYFAGSPALEWVGVVFGILCIAGRGMALFVKKHRNRMSPAEAKAWLEQEFGA